MADELWYLDASELARRIRAREVSPVEVLAAHLERIESVNPKINAIVTMVESAEESARAAERAVMGGEELGPLHGVPFTIKDGVDTAKVRTTYGSKLFEDHVPYTDATVVTRLKDAGGVLMAKTNLPEFALAGQTDNRVFGVTENPWRIGYTAGGSSGGEASAIAAGLSPLGVGSDVGGSIRSPAHFCGIAGLKATHGRIPLTGHKYDAVLRAVHVGPMARTVRDVALGLKIMAGADGLDPGALEVPVADTPDLDAPLAGLRVGWHAGEAFGPTDPEIVAAIERAATNLAEAGCDVEEVSLPLLESDDIQTRCLTMINAELALWLESAVAGREDELSANVQRVLGLPLPTLREYLEARDASDRLRQETAAYFSRYHLLLCPVKPTPAYPHETTELHIFGKTVGVLEAGRANVPWNFTGSPALAVPFGWSAVGLPFAVQLVGRHFDETTVLRAAAKLEAAHGADTRRPPV